MFVLGSDVQGKRVGEGITRKVLAYQGSLMLTENRFEKGAAGPVHAHPHEQISYVTRGSFSFTLGEEERIVRAGDSIYVPGSVEHGSTALEADSVLIDVFTPQREDFLT